ncbi:MAG: decarboxylating 6-phosphogluconate dehydrogenase [Coprobacillus sp.]
MKKYFFLKNALQKNKFCYNVEVMNGGAYNMEIALIGLGKMGANLALNLKDHNHKVIGYDLNDEARSNLQKEGIETTSSLDEQLSQLKGRKVVWMMVPSGEPTETIIENLMEKLSANDILIEAGNSNFKDSMRRAAKVNAKGIQYLDVGTSGGTSGARNGACLMIGGSEEAYNYLETVFKEISVDKGCMYTGKSGSGHFMKMIHNGVEYGMMQAIGEGFQLMEQSEFEFDLPKVAENWNHGSVIRGWLMELAEAQLKDHPHLENYKGIVEASGEAKWTVETALEMEVPAPVIVLSLMMRNRSKEDDSFSGKVVAALRNGFGGHAFVEADKNEN